MTLRPIVPMLLPADAPRATEFGKKPETMWVAPTDLLVDEEYQRDINRRSMALIGRIVAGFAWRKVKPPIVVRVDDGLHVIDGQHTAIAAATLKIPKIMVFVVEAVSAADRADSFVAHNQDRITMSPLDIYRAKVGGGVPDALAVAKVCKAAGVRLRVLSKHITPKIGDCAAVSVVSSLVARRGPAAAESVLKALVKGGRAPISRAELVAAETVMFGPDPLSVDQLARAVTDLGDKGVQAAHVTAKTDRVAVQIPLADKYRRTAMRLARD